MSYRFDAWLLGLVSHRLQEVRAAAQQEKQGPGLYLGAYAWVEDLRPSTAQLDPVRVDADLEATFAGPTPLRHDVTNGGYVHAPSLPHAQAAAVLRSGYIANASRDTPDTLSVNLSSDRVRIALSLLEGVRNGQSIGALHGYGFERGLHDAHALAEVDKFIYPLRKAFPLVADSLASTQTPPDVPIEAIEARNVLDGRKLLDRVRSTGNANYPFGLTDLPAATGPEAAAIDAQVDAMRDVDDAVADVALAEAVHQAVQGNFDRAAATLDAYGSATFPPDPEVVQTPAPGIGLTHRVAVHFRPGLPAPANATPRATVEPAVDDWLGSVLPKFTDIGCTVVWTDPIGGGARSADVTIDQLGLRPLDLLELVKPDDVQAMSELDDRILRLVHSRPNSPRADAKLQIRYRAAPAGAALSVFEVSALVRNLRALVQQSRPIRATDALLANNATPAQDAQVFADHTRITGPKGTLDTIVNSVGTYLATLAPLVADPVANRAAILAGIDGFLDDAVALLERTSRFGLPQSGWGFAYDWRRQAMHDLLALVVARVDDWDARLVKFDQALNDYDALPAATPDAERFQLLQAAEALVAAHLDPPPNTPAALRSALPAKRLALQTKRGDFHGVAIANHASLVDALNAVRARLPIDAVDLVPFDLTPIEDRVVTFAEDLSRTVTSQQKGLKQRQDAVQAQLDAYAAATTASAQVQALQRRRKHCSGSRSCSYRSSRSRPTRAASCANAVAAGRAARCSRT